MIPLKLAAQAFAMIVRHPATCLRVAALWYIERQLELWVEEELEVTE